jgi:phytoene synthase
VNVDGDARSRADYAACRAAIRVGSRSFHAASLLMPRMARDPAYALYAFCRIADDAVDDTEAKAEALEELRERLALAYMGMPADAPADRAFAQMVRDWCMPRDLPEALIEGLAWDAEARRYDDLSALRAYSARVAGSVGAMMTVIMGVRDPEVLARACDLGVAMQLTNICRDIGEDARAGRLFLPIDWMREEGLDPDGFLASPVFSPALERIVRRLLAEAERLYDRAAHGIGGLPGPVRPAIRAARLLYREIGRELARGGYDSVSRRAYVSAGRKRLLLVEAMLGRGLPDIGRDAPPLPETAFLVDAVTAAPRPRAFVRPTVGDHIGRMAEIMMDAQERETVTDFRGTQIAGE